MSGAAVVRVLAASVAASRQACHIIREVLTGGDLGIVDKGKNDLQTAADRAGQMAIVAHMRAKFPDLVIVGEEDGSLSDADYKTAKPIPDCQEGAEAAALICPEELSDYKVSDLVLWVDPLDGTSEFTQGLLDHVTVMVGISARGKSVAGVVAQPFYRYKEDCGPQTRLLYAVVGLGMYGLTPGKPPAGENIITTTRSHSSEAVNDAVDACKPSSVLRVGGCGHKVMLLLEGTAHAYVFASPGCKKWDTCAPEALLHAAGGWLTDIHGNFIQYYADLPRPNCSGVLATLRDHQWYLDCIPAKVKSELPAYKAKPVINKD